ncbi:MAG: alpha/beta fold hydrolase [Phycisphaerae bacterium]|nr:alpha/beta fold hydrolase [Phycisphaerae bacterium]
MDATVYPFLADSLWQHLNWNWALLSMVGTLLTVIGLSVAILARYVRIMLNILADTPPPLSMGPLDFQRMEGEHVQFRAADGVSLHGMFLYGDRSRARKGMIIFCHEFASDMYSSARYCRPLLEAGFDVFTFDFRGHGRSSNSPDYTARQWPSDKEVADCIGAFAYVQSVLAGEGLPENFGVFGISRGAGAALMAMAGDEAAKCIVADGAFSTDVTLESLMKKWAYIFARVKFLYENHPPAFWRFLRWVLFLFAPRRFHCRFPSVRKALVRMTPRPVFFIHGERDSYIRSEQTRFLYALAPQPKFLWIVPSAKHNQSVVIAPDAYRVRTVAFFERFLTGIEGSMEHLEALTPSIAEVA